MKKLCNIVASCLLPAFLAVRGFAAGFSPTSITDSLAPYDITSGWDFMVTTNFQVTALDYYDSGAAGGLLTSHLVALWTYDGTLISSATIPAGTAAPLIGNYRSVAITPIVLPPGYYEIGAFVPGHLDNYVYDATGTTQTGILYSGSHVATGPFTFPGSHNQSSTKEITANFEGSIVVGSPISLPLFIELRGTNAVLSWNQAGSNAVLQTAVAISGPWTNSLSTAILNGSKYYVTNAIEPLNNRFYRLKF